MHLKSLFSVCVLWMCAQYCHYGAINTLMHCMFHAYLKPEGLSKTQKVQNSPVEVIIYDMQEIPNMDKGIPLAVPKKGNFRSL